jgi:hypothetical protein
VSDVKVDFSVGAIGDVRRALEGLDKILERLDRTQNVRARRTVQQGDVAVRAAKKEADASVREATRADQAVSKGRERRFRDLEKWANQEVRTEQRKEREKTRALERADQAVSKGRERRFRDLEKWANQEVRTEQRKEREKTRALERETANRERIEARAVAKAERLAARAVAKAERLAAQEARARFRSRQAFGREVGSIAGRSVSGLVNGAGRLATTALTLGGAFSLADVAGRGMSAERAAIALSNSAYIPGENQRPDKGAILSRATSVQAATNIDKTDLIKGWQSYVAKSSDFSGGGANLMEMAKLAKATGSDFQDVMGAAGMLRTQNKNMTPEQMMVTMRNIVGQSKLGAVEMPDLAAIAGKVTATSAMYAGSQTETQRKLLGLSQIAMKTAGSPAEAATAVSRFGADVGKHALDLKKTFGVNATDEHGRVKDPGEVLADMMEAAHGNLTTMGVGPKGGHGSGGIGHMGLGINSIKLAEALAPTYLEAEAQKKGSGRAAVLAEVRRNTGAGYSQEDINKDFAAVMQATGEKFDGAVNRIKEVIEGKLTPWLERLAARLPELEPKIVRIINGLDQLFSWLVDNPWKGLGAIVAGTITKDLAAAGIGAAVNAALIRLMAGKVPVPGGGAPMPVPGATPAPGALGGAAIGGMLAAGAVTLYEGKEAIDAAGEGYGKGSYHAGELAVDAKDPSKAAQVRKELGGANAAMGAGGMAKTALAIGNLGFNKVKDLALGGGNDSIKQINETLFAKAIADNAEKISKSLAEAATKINNASAGMNVDPKRNQPMTATGRGGATPPPH